VSPIDRKALVRRHNPRLTEWDPDSPLSVGNGNFVFTADVTGFQTLRDSSPASMPLCTMSQWGLHSYPGTPGDEEALRLREYACGERTVGYMSEATGQEELFDSLRQNPHRFHLGNIGLFMEEASGDVPGGPARFVQTLDLWTGKLTSTFELAGSPVKSECVCHPDRDLLSFRLTSPLVRTGEIGLDLHFPYPSHNGEGADWTGEERHRSDLIAGEGNRFFIERTLDDLTYGTVLLFSEETGVREKGPHRWIFTGEGDVLEFSLLFSPGGEEAPLTLFAETEQAAARHWKQFWTEGAALSFEGSTDPRAFELERRIVLSQYLLALQSLGSLPPAETGLTCNSWYGKFHLEMHIWHALHGLLWGREDLVERSLEWYTRIMPAARRRAEKQGYAGVRWPKMTDPEGRDSPSPIGTLLCWQQPHIILFAELLYRARADESVLERYADRVFETAEFMADYPLWDGKRYVLGPPVIPAQENHKPEETLNPAFEVEYWRWALDTALMWKKRLNREAPEKWGEVRDKMSPCPKDEETGLYMAHENCTDTYGVFATDHPAMLFAYGLVPGGTVDRDAMSRSYDAVLANWRFETMWGWDFPASAMTLARLGRRESAVDMLLREADKNTYVTSGHNRQIGYDGLPLYLPGNGGLLLAAAMMAAGWDGSEGEAPGFPDDGSWKVRSEGLKRYI